MSVYTQHEWKAKKLIEQKMKTIILMRNLFVILISVIEKALIKSIKHSLSSTRSRLSFDLKLVLENFIQCISS